MNKIALSLIFGIATGFATDAFAVTKKKIDFVVGVDGDFKQAIAAASAAVPSESNRFVIFFPDGEYDLTKLTADRHGKTTFSTSYVSLIGQTRDKAIIANKTDTESIGHTATLYFPKNYGMYMQDLTIQNKSTYCTSGTCREVTIQQNEGDKFIFKNVKLVSGQDTYYTKKGRTYWEGGEIQGTVDFICGGGDVFFEGTNLVMTRNGGYITASQNPGTYGYVFNNSKINVSNGSFNGSFYLGRSWGAAKVVFLNTTMYAQPTAEGWGPDMNSAPVVFGEYNSKNGNGGAVDVSRRKTYFNGGKNSSTARTLKTVWDASDAAKYTLANVMGGSDNWEPNKLTQQVSAPKISQEGGDIVWADDENARCWAIFVNGKYKGSTATNSYPVDGIAAGSKVTVRAANSMGGLGGYSNEISTVEDHSTYFKVNIGTAIGGTVESSVEGKIAEGKTATITAKPAAGWTFAGWTGANAKDIDATKTSVEIKGSGDIELIPSFEAKGVSVFQAESGPIENAVYESTNAGFAGTGYVNFGAGAISYVNIPVYADAKGEYKMVMSYANGSTASRSLSIKSLADGADAAQEIAFESTGDWKKYPSVETTINLSKGASYIQFATVGGNDGPNLDQIELIPVNVEEEPNDTSKTDGIYRENFNQNFANRQLDIQIFSLQGKLIRSVKASSLETSELNLSKNLPAGSYLLRISAPGFNRQRIIRIQ